MDSHTKRQLNVGDEGEGNTQLVPFVKFNYGDVDDALDVHEFVRDADLRAGAIALNELIAWLYGPEGKHPTGEARRARAATVRLYAMFWCVKPELFDGASTEQVASLIGVDKSMISQVVKSFRERFKFAVAACRTVPQDTAAGGSMPQHTAAYIEPDGSLTHIDEDEAEQQGEP